MKKANQIKNVQFARRHARVRAKISGSAERPRLSIFKSHKNIYAQIIDDVKGHTIVAFDGKKTKASTPLARATEVGKGIAKVAIAAKVKKVVFDRGGYLYAGKIKAVADGAREGGLEF